MFGNAYQNGHYFEVWDSRATNDKNQLYKQLVRIVPASNKNFFQKQVKSYIYSLEGQNTKMIFPASDQKQLALHQKYLVLHLFIPHASQWSMQLGITDINGIKRRVNLTTAQGKMQIKYFSVRYPLDNIQKGTWLFLAINVHSFIEPFKNQVFRSLDHITIGSNCLLRRVFTMKQWLHWQVPKTFWLSNQIAQQFQLIQYRELSLPKIINKSVMYDQNSPNVIENKSSSIQHSKSNLTKSEISPKPLIKNNGIIQSQSSGKKSEPLPRQKTSTISKSNIVNENKIKQLRRKQSNIRKSQYIPSKIYENKMSEERQPKQLKSSPKKSPMIQKSFQQDQAFNKEVDDDGDFQTSNESFNQRPIKNSRKYEKWQQQAVSQIRGSKNNQNESNEGKQRVINKSNRTVLTKENSVKKIYNIENKSQLQLIYDEMVGFYYHPETHTYYQLKQ